jgi:hypothetical protein
MTTFNNDSLKSELGSEFVRLNDPINRWSSTVSSFQAIPGLVGFWPMSSVQRSTGNVYDLSGQGRTLTYNGNPTFSTYNSFLPYCDFDGTGDYLSRADETDLDISGTETIYGSNIRGLTIGGWFRNDGAGATDGLIGKWNDTGNQRSYLLLTIGDAFRFALSSNGSTSAQVDSFDYTPGVWYFVIGRSNPAASEMTISVDDLSGTIAGPTSIFSSTADFQIGAYNAGTQNLTGDASLCFLSGMCLSNQIVNMLFQQSRILFGK